MAGAGNAGGATVAAGVVAGPATAFLRGVSARTRWPYNGYSWIDRVKMTRARTERWG